MKDHEREDLVNLATAGDAEALQRLILDYHNPLRAALASGMDQAIGRQIDPDDVLQEAYASAFRSVTRCRFSSPAQFYRWLKTVAFNELSNRRRQLRSQKRDVARELHRGGDSRSSYPDFMQQLAGPDSTPSHKVARGEAEAAVISSLARLSDDQRLVVCMRFLEGAPVSDVATRLGKSEAAVHMLCHRGLNSLRGLIVSISRYLSNA